jgi:hypothetical protein
MPAASAPAPAARRPFRPWRRHKHSVRAQLEAVGHCSLDHELWRAAAHPREVRGAEDRDPGRTRRQRRSDVVDIVRQDEVPLLAPRARQEPWGAAPGWWRCGRRGGPR